MIIRKFGSLVYIVIYRLRYILNNDKKSPLKKTKSGTDIEYSKIEFTNTPSIPPVHSAKRKPSKAQLLRQAEAKRQKLEELKETKPEKAVVVENKMAWETMIKRASGEKSL